jgi:hypothetical protein
MPAAGRRHNRCLRGAGRPDAFAGLPKPESSLVFLRAGAPLLRCGRKNDPRQEVVGDYAFRDMGKSERSCRITPSPGGNAERTERTVCRSLLSRAFDLAAELATVVLGRTRTRHKHWC